jgi:hypothetical protein
LNYFSLLNILGLILLAFSCLFTNLSFLLNLAIIRMDLMLLMLFLRRPYQFVALKIMCNFIVSDLDRDYDQVMHLLSLLFLLEELFGLFVIYVELFINMNQFDDELEEFISSFEGLKVRHCTTYL